MSAESITLLNTNSTPVLHGDWPAVWERRQGMYFSLTMNVFLERWSENVHHNTRVQMLPLVH